MPALLRPALALVFAWPVAPGAGEPPPFRHEHLLLTRDGWRPFAPGDLERLAAARLDLELPPGAPFVTEPARAAAPFAEALPSFNAEVGDGARLEIEIAVAGPGGDWSPWFGLGGWGDLEPAAREIPSFAGGRPEIDIFRAAGPDSRFERARLRLTAGGAGGKVRLVRLAVCLSHRTEDAESRAAPGAAHTGEPAAGAVPFHIEVPFRSQQAAPEELRERICSPTSVAMILEHHGVARATQDVAGLLHDPHWLIYGNWSRAAQGYFQLSGGAGILVRFGDFAAAEAVLRRGQPLVASIGVRPGELTGAPYEQTAGHLLVLTGVDAGGNVHVNDPAAPEAATGVTVYRRDELERVWLARGGTAYLLLPPMR